MEDGSLFRHYYVINKIGKGSMCEIFLAFDLKTKRFVAIKTLHEHHASVPTFIKRMHRESEIYKNINHNTIVRYHDSNFEDDDKYVAMEYLKGSTLTNTLRSEGGSLFLHDGVRIMENICEALHQSHRAGIVHRDIKPDNIMVDSDGNAKLYDFGIAYADDQMLQTRVGDIKLVGLYASPEQVMGGKLDERSDLYSLGLVSFEMLTGTKLHLCKTIEQFMQIFQKPAPPASQQDSSIPPSIDNILMKLLAPKPEDRYQSAKDLLIELGTLRLTASEQEKQILFGKEADLLFDKAYATYEKGEYRETVAICQELEDSDVHRKASMYLLLARAAKAMDRPEISVRYLEKAAFLKVKDFSIAMDYFCELIARNELAKAADICKREYKSKFDKDVTAALIKMLSSWEEPDYIEARRLPQPEPKSFLDKMKSFFG